MDNFLSNGTVLPSGLLTADDQSAIAGFNKAYRNTQLRMGIVSNCYPISDAQNVSKLTTEYDVVVFEQCEDRGSTIITYRNCINVDGMGSIADFFEKTLRTREGSAVSGVPINTSGQNGAVVLLQCLDGMSDKAIIVGAINHPDRSTNLANSQPYLEGEYNGVNITVENDGSTTLTFKGATDNDGNPVDSSQGNTVVSIATDGSFQVKHSKITFTLAKSGNVTITATGNTNINCTDATITATGKATVEGSSVLLGKGAAEAVIKGDTFKGIFNSHIHPTAVGPSGPPTSPMDSSLSKKVKTE